MAISNPKIVKAYKSQIEINPKTNPQKIRKQTIIIKNIPEGVSRFNLFASSF